MNKPAIVNIAPQIIVTDPKRTAQYYCTVLGFSLIGYFPSEAETGYAMVQRDGFNVHFGLSDKGMISLNRDLRAGMPDFLMWVPDIEAFYAEVTVKGARIHQGIIQRSYGREFIIEDCDGHHVHICD